jgi:hypothetical protein
MFSTGFSSGAREGRKTSVMFFRGDEVASGVPAGAVEQQNGVSALGDDEGDLVQVELHGLGIGVGQG